MSESKSQNGNLVYLIAGEHSGDRLGGPLMAALKENSGTGIQFAGIGGPEMARQGLQSLFPMSDLSVMGIAEVLPRIPKLLARIRETVADIEQKRPAAVITIDAPDFSFRVAKRLMGKGIPLIHYVAPSVWVWRPGRAAKIAVFLDHLLTLLPFEPDYFRAEGLAATFIGHSVVESAAADGDGQKFRKIHNIPPDAPLIVVLPGSRRGEVSRLLPIFGDTVAGLQGKIENLHVVIPTVDSVAAAVRSGVRNWKLPINVVDGDEAKFDAFAAGNVGLAASGTVALELAMSGLPSVVAYRMNPLTALLSKRLIRAPYANLVNVILDREAVPECLLERCRPDILEAEVLNLLQDPAKQADQRQAYGDVMEKLGLGDDMPPSRRAARVVLDLIS